MIGSNIYIDKVQEMSSIYTYISAASLHLR